MEHVEAILKAAVSEIKSMLSSKSVVGEPITIAENTVIPLVSMGFGFGAGGGSGSGTLNSDSKAGQGMGGGSGGAGGIKPVAVVVMGPGGVRVEPLKGRSGVILERMADTVAGVVNKAASEKIEKPAKKAKKEPSEE